MGFRKPSVTPIFYRLLVSYSLISVLPLAVVWFMTVVWGNNLIARYLRSAQEQSLLNAAETTDHAIDRFLGITSDLARSPYVVSSIDESVDTLSADHELELYRALYSAIADDLEVVDVHLTDARSRRFFSTGEYPRRYRLDDYQNRRDFVFPGEGTRIVLNPRPEEQGGRIVFSVWSALPGGYLILDIRNEALRSALDVRSSSRVFLVDRQNFRAYNLSQPTGESTFAAVPELGIAFSSERYRRAAPTLLVHRVDIGSSSLSMVMTTDLSTYFETLRAILRVAAVILVGTALITLAVSGTISRSISRPIHDVLHAMSSDGRGPQPLDEHADRQKSGELHELIVHYNLMVHTIQDLFQKVREEEKAQRIAERRALEAQIQPHFLYNTLGSIKSMAKLGDVAAVTSMVTDLGKMLRFLLSDDQSVVTLGESLEQVKRYLNIQAIRFQERMKLEFRIDPASLDIEIPKLLVQPLVENAVQHGVEVSTSPVDIRIATRRLDGHLTIEVEDTGEGVEETTDLDHPGIGLQNVRERLRSFYGEEATFELTRQNGVTTARMRIRM